LALQALLYAGGELPDADAATFERRLADDQSARDALVQAVQLAQLAQQLRPDPAYRQRVRQRLRSRPGLWQALVGKRSYRGHPLLWAVAGAVAAALLVAVLLPRPKPEVIVVSTGAPEVVESPLALPDDDPDAFDVARVWAETPKGEHLAQAR